MHSTNEQFFKLIKSIILFVLFLSIQVQNHLEIGPSGEQAGDYRQKQEILPCIASSKLSESASWRHQAPPLKKTDINYFEYSLTQWQPKLLIGFPCQELFLSKPFINLEILSSRNHPPTDLT